MPFTPIFCTLQQFDDSVLNPHHSDPFAESKYSVGLLCTIEKETKILSPLNKVLLNLEQMLQSKLRSLQHSYTEWCVSSRHWNEHCAKWYE